MTIIKNVLNKLKPIVQRELSNWQLELELLAEKQKCYIRVSESRVKKAEERIAELTELSLALDKSRYSYSYVQLAELKSILKDFKMFEDQERMIEEVELRQNRILKKRKKELITCEKMSLLKVGDFVAENLVDHFINVLPPFISNNLIQISEAADTINGQHTYPTLWRCPFGWVYAGNCHYRNNTEPYRRAPIYYYRSMEERIIDAFYNDYGSFGHGLKIEKWEDSTEYYKVTITIGTSQYTNNPDTIYEEMRVRVVPDPDSEETGSIVEYYFEHHNDWHLIGQLPSL